MKILALSGSAREASTNTALLRAISALAPQSIEISVFHQVNLLPVFSPDDEGENTPAAVQKFIEAVVAADGIIISSPEYIRAIPGGLKNAIDWIVSRIEIIDKPIALVHASIRGDDMLSSLRKVLSTVSGNFFEHIFLRFTLTSKTPQEIAELMHFPEYKPQIIAFLLNFVAAIQQSEANK
ncbi:NADPH-dependent FMN reductase [Acinetobacter baumannii]